MNQNDKQGEHVLVNGLIICPDKNQKHLTLIIIKKRLQKIEQELNWRVDDADKLRNQLGQQETAIVNLLRRKRLLLSTLL